MEKCTSKVRCVAGMYRCRSRHRRTKQMRADGNAECRACRVGDYFRDGALGHRLSIDGKPKRIGIVPVSSQGRPIEFQLFVDGIAKIVLYRPLVGSLFLGLGGRQ